jgi:glycoprotein endo-alpha-1,2-mannosidase
MITNSVQPSRREFLQALGAAGLGVWAAPVVGAAGAQPGRERLLNTRFSDLRRHFIFEYYPWYETSPYRHWDEAKRKPPVDVGSNYMPRLGAYNSADTRVLEQHARWIADVGVGAINVSWWGPGDFTDRTIPVLMDVMSAYDIHVAFHLEPYTDRHGANYARDIQYLLKEYGDRRSWDCFLLLQHADGTVGPVFKSFRTIVPESGMDCHGNTFSVADFTTDGAWRQQTDRVRETFRRDFDRITLLADSVNVERTRAGGFDGIAIYDNFVKPDTWDGYASQCTSRDLVFSFNINPGFDAVVDREPPPPDSCPGGPTRFEPGGAEYDWSRLQDRERAARASLVRISECFNTTIDVQTNPASSNAKRGFFLTYINSFNEWHEGHQFEPMKDSAALSPEERAVGYHNPADGMYRLKRLGELLADLDL